MISYTKALTARFIVNHAEFQINSMNQSSLNQKTKISVFAHKTISIREKKIESMFLCTKVVKERESRDARENNEIMFLFCSQ